MHINLESADKYSIQAYDDEQVKVDTITYQNSLIISRYGIITDWNIHHIDELVDTKLAMLLESNPKIIILGHKNIGKFLPYTSLNNLLTKQIGIECMSIGAACRTYNVLLSEQRDVVLVILF